MTNSPAKSYPAGKRLLTQGEAAAYLSTCAQTLKSWPICPRVRPDGRKVYDIRDLDVFADNLPADGEVEEVANGAGWEDFNA